MNPSSLSWPLNVKSTANQMKVASTSPSLAMSSSVSTPVASSTPRPRNAIAVESSPRVAADAPERHHAGERDRHDLLVRLKGPMRGERLPAPLAAPRASPSLRAESPCKQQGSSAMADERRDRRGDEPRAEADLDAVAARRSPRRAGFAAIAVNHSAEDRVRLAMPENIRKAPEPRPRSGARRRTHGLGHRQRQRIEHAGARGVARETRGRSRRPRGRRCSRGRASSGRRRLTTRLPSRAPSPHFTTARATRNATTMSRIVPLANPE